MSSFNEISKPVGQSTYEELGLNKKPKTDAAKSSQVLGQDDFLKLMTTQLQNQDPFSPMENGDFIAQMAQFSTVTGIDEVNKSLANMSNQYEQGRIATAASLLGHSILVPSPIASPDEAGQIHGVLELPEQSASTSVKFFDTDTESLVHTIELGSTPAGMIGFRWEGIPTELTNSGKTFRIEATAKFASGDYEIKPSTYAQVVSVSHDERNKRVELNTATETQLELSEITEFK